MRIRTVEDLIGKAGVFGGGPGDFAGTIVAIRLARSSSVILVGCADDLVVSDPGSQYAGSGVRCDSFVYSSAAAFAEVARFSRGQ
jgi:hypothetical protein